MTYVEYLKKIKVELQEENENQKSDLNQKSIEKVKLNKEIKELLNDLADLDEEQRIDGGFSLVSFAFLLLIIESHIKNFNDLRILISATLSAFIITTYNYQKVSRKYYKKEEKYDDATLLLEGTDLFLEDLNKKLDKTKYNINFVDREIKDSNLRINIDEEYMNNLKKEEKYKLLGLKI